jgi:hypothetical protein
VILDDAVLEEIDELVGSRGRSRFPDGAAREKLARLRLEAALRATAGVVREDNYPYWRDRDETAEWVRASRRRGQSGYRERSGRKRRS